MKTTICFQCAYHGSRWEPCEEHVTTVYNPNKYKGNTLAEKAINYKSNPFQLDFTNQDLIDFGIEVKASFIYQVKYYEKFYWINWSDNSYILIDKNNLRISCMTCGSSNNTLKSEGNRFIWERAQ